MPNWNPTTWAWSTVQNWSLSLEDQALLGSDIKVTDESNQTSDPLTWAGATVQTTETDLNLWAPTDNIVSQEEVTTWGVTPEQQAEFDRQQAEGDRIMREQEQARIKAEQEAEAKRLEEQAKKQAEITTVTTEQQAEFDRQQAEADRLVAEWKALPPEQIQDITTFKQAGWTLDNLASLVSNKYGGLPEIQWDKVIWEIDGVPYEWVIDESGNPIRSKIEEKVTIWKDEFIETLSWMFVWGSSDEDIKKYITDNKDVYNSNKNAIISAFKTAWINKETIKRNQSIAKMNGDEIDKAIKSWKINVWDLSVEAKQRYDAYLNVNRNNDINNTKNANELVYELPSENNTFSQNTTNYVNNLKGKSKDIKDLYNTSDFEESRNSLNSSYKEIKKKKRELENIWDKIREDNKWTPSGLVNAKIAKEQRRLTNELNQLIDWYNVELSNYQLLEREADREAEVIKFEMSIDEIEYNSQLEEYKFRRWEMSNLQQLKLQEESNIRAENRKNEFTLELLNNEREYALQNKSWVYQTDRDWSLLYVVDWVAETVKKNDWTVVWLVRENSYTDTVNELKDGWFEILRTYKDWSVKYFTRWISGEDIMNASMGAEDVIAQIPNTKLWCWQFTNQYGKKWWLISATTWEPVWVWNSYESKKEFINSQVPQVWWLAVWNPVPEWEFWENWHIWIVTWYNPSDWTIQITDSNSQWNKERRTYSVNIEQITNSDGGFVHMKKPWVEKPKYSADVESWGKQIQRGQAKLSDITWQPELKTKVVEYLENEDLVLDQDNPIIQWLKENSDILDEIVDWREWWTWFFGNDTTNESLIESVSGWFQFSPVDSLTWNKPQLLRKLQFILDAEVLQNLVNLKSQWATFGALSNEELGMLQKSAWVLNSSANRDKDWNITWFTISETDMKKELENLKKFYKKAIENKTWVPQLWLDDINSRLWATESNVLDLSNSLDY